MSATTGAIGSAVPQQRGGVLQTLRDSRVVAKRNLRRMTRIPNPVGPCWVGFTSPSTQVSGLAWALEGGAL